MSKDPLTITIDPDSELGRALDGTDDSPVILERNGARFRVIRADDLWADYDPDAVLAGLHAIAGTVSPEEGDWIVEGIYRMTPGASETLLAAQHVPHRIAVRPRCYSLKEY
jgi:hypothetical protein